MKVETQRARNVDDCIPIDVTMSATSWLLIQYPHQNTVQLNSADEGYCARYCRFTIHQVPLLSGQTMHCSSLNLVTYHWVWEWQERLSVLSFIFLPLVLKKHKCERDRGRRKEWKWVWGSKWPARVWKIVCSFTAHTAWGTIVYSAVYCSMFNPSASDSHYMDRQV